jgi:hypothetical protein
MLRAVDINQIVFQSHSMEKVHQAQQQHPEMQQRYLDIQLSEEKKQLKEHVSHAQDAEEVRVGMKEERGSSNGKARERQERGKQEALDTEDAEDGRQGTYVDIKV